MPNNDIHKAEGESPLEQNLDETFTRTLDEGMQRLHRKWYEVLATGFVGGMEVALGLLALIAVREATGSTLLAGLAFSIGFLALLLGRSELFTEGFLVPITTVAAGRARWSDLARLWSGTLLANLAGGWFLTALLMAAYPELHATTVEAARHFAEAEFGLRVISLALLGGAVITLMTRMQHGTSSMPAKIAAAVAGAFLITGLEMFHSVVDSLLIFAALHTGTAPFGYAAWIGWFGYTVVLNIVGGVVLVTLLRLIRSKDRIVREREQAAADGR
ncbi:MAG TPA: formate/nitrite transporter family protein [Pseudonocardia sp.]|jgi:formate-nitrite transporter family protein|nr:formate/nitrite transporter family protein [Pseudonocardia sp.]